MKQIKLILSDEAHKTINDLVVCSFLADNDGGLSQGWRKILEAISDGKDDHFRKAWFNPNHCPSDCLRPCEKICPANAIGSVGGIISNRCYGCGRCLPQCPLGLIHEKHFHLDLKAIAPLIKQANPDAIEVHTAPGRSLAFKALLNELISLKRESVLIINIYIPVFRMMKVIYNKL